MLSRAIDYNPSAANPAPICCLQTFPPAPYFPSMIMSVFRTANASRFFTGSVVGLLLVLGCSKDDPVTGKNLCPDAGVGIRVEGRSAPMDVCVTDEAVDALLTSSNHYDVSAQLALDDGTLVQLRMVFTQHASVPVTLRLVNTTTEATSDPSTAYVYYEEAPNGGTPIQSTLITGGTFRLTFNAADVAVGTLTNISFDMTNVQNGDPAGERRITEGFFSVTVTPPVAVSGPPALSSR